MFVDTEYKLNLADNAYLIHFVLYKIIITKMPENEKQKIREDLEEITKELVKIEDEYNAIQKKIDRLPNSQLYKLKGLCNEKSRLFTRKKFLENEKHNKINLLQLTV